LIHNGNVFVFGAAGDLHSVVLETGAKRWSRAVLKDYGGDEGYFGAGSTPIVAGGKLLVNVGGRGAGIVAFNLETGEEVWKATDEGASYSSPALIDMNGTPAAVFITRLNLLVIDPATGKVVAKTPFGQRGPTVNGASPIVLDGHVFATASYGIGALWAKLEKDSFTRVWSDETLASQYPTPVPYEGYLYGADGRDDVGVARFRAINPSSGKVAWTQEAFGLASAIVADGKLLLLKTDGTLVLAEATPKKFTELASAQVLTTTTRALPALANGLLFVRDTKTLKCLEVGAK
jgi:outer membrane protein assembly factor BamB